MKRLSVLLLCGVALLLVGGRKQELVWETPYTPTRLEWLALQCNLNHRQRHEFVHASFIAMPPNTLEVVVKFGAGAKKEEELRQSVRKAAKEYAIGMAKAMGWTDPIKIEVVDVALK